MAWPVPPGQWNSAVPMAAGADMSMGSYTPEQWTMMQQQSWQWAQWQQQYAQWQNQYGDKYNQQLQGMQAMGLAPPLPASNVPPPAPPPPEKPPPPPHENDEPLFSKPKGPEPVPAPNSNYGPNNDRHSFQKMPNEDNKLQPGTNTEALKKLAEEERVFDIQFKKWEEEIEKWKEENVNHPDKRAYSEYEQKFEACRAQLMERRQQMKLKRDRLLGNINPQSTANNSNMGNKSNSAPPQQYNKPNYTISAPPVQQGYKNNSARSGNNRNISQSQYNMPQHNLNRDNRSVNSQEQYDSYDNQDSNDCYMQDDFGTVIEDDSTFLPSGASAKGIPGLDLVPEQNDVIEIPDDQYKDQQNSNDYYNHSPKKAPDYSTISQGINNILGDEKIMNILSMVSGQKPSMGNNLNNFSNLNAPPNHPPPLNNQWGRNDNYRQQNDYNNANANYPPTNQQSQFNNSMQQQGNYNNSANVDSYNNSNVDGYNNQGNQYGGQNVTRNLPQPLMQINTQIRPQNVPQKPSDYPQGPNRRGIQENWASYPDTPAYNEEYGMQDRKNPLIPNMSQMAPLERMQELPPVVPPVKPKWVTEPMFAPSVIVEYEHKPLRLKAREFMEPVHTFDYNHVSKDGENVNKRKFEEEADQIFSKALRTGDKDWSREKYSKDYRDKPRHEIRSEFDAGRDVYHRRHYDRRLEDRDRTNKFEDFREREYDRIREPRDRNIGKDYERDRDFGRDRDLGRERDFGRDRDLGRERDIGRDRDYGRDRDLGMDRDLGRDRDFGRDRDRDRLYGRDRDRDVGRDRDLERDYGRDKYKRGDRNRSHSKDRENRKRGLSKESEVSNTSLKKTKTAESFDGARPKHVVMIDDILEHPGRDMRPMKIVIVLRGPPGSGKSYLAKLIRDREAEYGGAARIMSIDDYFMQEGEVEEEDPATGKIVKKPLLKYEYDEGLEESYINSLKRAFKRSITDGYFSFLIYDAVNDQLKGYADIWNFARQNGFQVYICTMELDPQVCFKRNIHNRKLEEIEVISSRFFPTPAHHIQLDATTLLQSASITEVQMEDVSNDDVVEVPLDEEPEVENSFTSKWEKMDDVNQLARLDGTSKPLRPSQLSMEDYLQLDDWKPNTAKPGKKTVRWADLEERRQQEKMRAIGFVVGQTDWNRMTDPTMGSSALTQTKYIERVRRN